MCVYFVGRVGMEIYFILENALENIMYYHLY